MLITELNAVGLVCTGLTNGIPVIEGATDQDLVDLVVVARDKQDGDQEITDLKDYLGAGSDEWLAYVTARQAPAKDARQKRYRDETDPMRLKADEDHIIGSDDWDTAIQAWRDAKDQIRLELPYPVE